MSSSPYVVISLYVAALLCFLGAVQLRHEPWHPSPDPLARGLERGELAPGVPRLDPDDAMANAALLRLALDRVGNPGLDETECQARPRSFGVRLDGHTSFVHFGARAVCQLRALKRISVAQPGFGHHGLGEVAAFLLGRRDGERVEVTRIVVPPFRFTGDRVSLLDVDLGPLHPGERFIGTFHTHPDDDLEEGILSTVDLRYFRVGYVDFHGQVGALAKSGPGLDWLFDIVEPRDGDWNVYAHDRDLLEELRRRCADGPDCPLGGLRLAGSRYDLYTRYFEDRPGE